mmetsp:Transcript_11750/g.17792  ORF Transcript_11750/g.17792 Transcript_11750/m.17792 type:complete len:375 (-) Transcript_11750:58-1182(-)
MRILAKLLTSFVFASLASNALANVVKVKDFDANTEAGRGLLAAATRDTEGDSNSDARWLEDMSRDTSFLGSYSIKFQDCHGVSQWNENYDASDGSDSRVSSRRLVRFRLCPGNSCVNNKKGGCSSQFGDYIVDINTFMYYYLSAQAEFNDEITSYCATECAADSSADQYCESECFYNKGGFKYYDGYSAMNPSDYAQCSQFKNYLYVGPYCSDDGASIHLGLFSDDTCSTFASCDSSCFYSTYGFDLPYATDSLVSKNCMSCAEDGLSSNYNNYGQEARSECGMIYGAAGKCETKMYIDYPNESACTYIQGIKYLKQDGVISGGVKRNKTAAMAIGLLSFSTLVIGIYVHYLATKFQRAKFHLESGTSYRREKK